MKVSLSKRKTITLLLVGGVLFLFIGIYAWLVYAGYVQLGAKGIIGKGSRGAALSKGATAPSKTWYFAEGCTRDNPEFDTFLCLQNPQDKQVTVNVTFALAEGQGNNVTKSYTLPKKSRFTINVNDAVGQEKDVAMTVSSTEPIVAERAMYFVYNGKYGSTSSVGSPILSQRWYFPEGCTGSGFDEWILIYNPQNKDTDVQVQFRNQDGAVVKEQKMKVKAGRRLSLKANALAPDQWQIWTYVYSNLPVVAERAMYVATGDKSGGSNSLGRTNREADTSWYFGENYVTSSGSFQEYILVIDPQCNEGNKQVTLYGYSGGKQIGSAKYTLPQCGRLTIPVQAIDAFKDKTDLAIVVSADKKIIAERAIYAKHNFGGGVFVWDVTSETGIPGAQLSKTWYLPEGFTTSAQNNLSFLEYLILFNPTKNKTDVSVSFMKNNSQAEVKKFSIPAHTRLPVQVNGILLGEHSMAISSTQPITAERVIFQ